MSVLSAFRRHRLECGRPILGGLLPLLGKIGSNTSTSISRADAHRLAVNTDEQALCRRLLSPPNDDRIAIRCIYVANIPEEAGGRELGPLSHDMHKGVTGGLKGLWRMNLPMHPFFSVNT